MYTTYSHAKTNLKYHIIFSTKYRRKCLEKVRESVLNSFRYAEKDSFFKILIMNLEIDHIHFLITFKPSISISSVIRRLKQMSTISLWKEEEKHFRNFYWKKNKIWTGGYFVSTIGEVSEDKIIDYIKNQG